MTVGTVTRPDRARSTWARLSAMKPPAAREAVLPLLSVGEMTLRLYGALNYSQNSARDLRFALNEA